MKPQTTSIALTSLYCISSASAFTFVTSSVTSSSRNSNTELQMGLFDGVKDAFNAPPNDIAAERETPIDRWMGWSARGDESSSQGGTKAMANFIDAMDSANYVTAELEKPMGIVFEENGPKEGGGIFIMDLKEDGIAAKEGTAAVGDQLVAVNGKKVYGMDFDDALGAIIASETEKTKLLFFRGPSDQFYGPTGASEEWLTEFLAES